MGMNETRKVLSEMVAVLVQKEQNQFHLSREDIPFSKMATNISDDQMTVNQTNLNSVQSIYRNYS